MNCPADPPGPYSLPLSGYPPLTCCLPQLNLKTMTIDYLKKILTARVYDVASETPLELAPALSQRYQNRI